MSYTAVAGDTTVTIAAALLSLLVAMGEGEFRELTFATGSTTSKIDITGPADGAPFTFTLSGTGTFTSATSTAPLSPSDLADGVNYSTGALPSAADTLVFENSDVDAKYNGAALTAIALAAVYRRASHTGRIGLPRINDNGYPEYRAADVELNAPIVTVEVGNGDGAGHVRIKSVASTAVTFTVQGNGATGGVGNEVVHVHGLPVASVLRPSGGSVAVATFAGQTATVATLQAQASTVWLGSGVTLANATFTASTFRLDCSQTTLTTLRDSVGEVYGAAACGNAGLKVLSGSLRWRSTGSTGNSPVVGNGATVDFSLAPTGVAVGGTVELNAGAAWSDPAGKITTPYNILLNRCSLRDVSLDVSVSKTLAVS